MDQIAQQSGFGKATLYYYFKSKEDAEYWGKLSDEEFDAQVGVDVSKCMDIGLKALLKEPEFSLSNVTQDAAPFKTRIEKTHSWEELKKEF